MREALVVDDHPVVREGIKRLLEKSFPDIEIGESGGPESVTQVICGRNWAFVVLDINLPGRSGLDVLKKARASCPKLPIVVFSLYPEEQYAGRAFRAGANAYLSKDRPPQDLVDAIKYVSVGGRVALSPHAVLKGPKTLSDREVQVLSFLVKGTTRKEIARILSIHEKTVSTYAYRLREKLGLRTIVDLIHYAAEEGLVE